MCNETKMALLPAFSASSGSTSSNHYITLRIVQARLTEKRHRTKPLEIVFCENNLPPVLHQGNTPAPRLAHLGEPNLASHTRRPYAEQIVRLHINLGSYPGSLTNQGWLCMSATRSSQLAWPKNGSTSCCSERLPYNQTKLEYVICNMEICRPLRFTSQGAGGMALGIKQNCNRWRLNSGVKGIAAWLQ